MKARIDECADWIRGFLSNGQVLREEVMIGAENAGYNRSIVVRAAKRLGIISRRYEYQGLVSWSLVSDEAVE
jgi:hypothetical protein